MPESCQPCGTPNSILCPTGTNRGTSSYAARCDHTHDASEIVGLAAMILAYIAAGQAGNFIYEVNGPTAQSFVQPAVGHSVVIPVDDGSVFSIGGTIYVPGSGLYTVTAIDGDNVTAVLQPDNVIGNTGDTIVNNTIIIEVNESAGLTVGLQYVTDVSWASPNLRQTKQTVLIVNGRVAATFPTSVSTVLTAVSCT